MAGIFTKTLRAMRELPMFVHQNRFARTRDGQLYESADDFVGGVGIVEADPPEALLVTAKREDDSYALLLDLDMEAALLPSSTPGHYHLYVDTAMSKEEHDAVMMALADAGVIQRGYADSAMDSDFGSTLRPPWVKKGKNESLADKENRNTFPPF